MATVSRVEVFLQVVKQNSFTAAAKCLNMSAPAVSKQVKALEKQLGVKLLNRTTRQLTLTEQGSVYVELAGRAVDDLREAQRRILDLKRCPTGRLRINAPLSFGIQYLTEPLAEFALQYPDVVMDVDFDDRRVDVIAEGYDVVVRIGALKDSTLIARKLAECPILLCASPAYLELNGQPESPQDLENHAGLIYTKHDNLAVWQYIDQNGKIKKARLNRNFAANNAETLVQACLSGIGIALLPAFSASSHLKTGRLTQVLDQYRTHPEPAIYAIYPQNRYLSTKVRLLIDMLVDTCKQLPW